MPTNFPERRPQTGLNNWHYAGICIGLAGMLVLVASSGRNDPPTANKPASDITTGISPSDAKR
jgi:hypothetical protein